MNDLQCTHSLNRCLTKSPLTVIVAEAVKSSVRRLTDTRPSDTGSTVVADVTPVGSTKLQFCKKHRSMYLKSYHIQQHHCTQGKALLYVHVCQCNCMNVSHIRTPNSDSVLYSHYSTTGVHGLYIANSKVKDFMCPSVSVVKITNLK